MYWTGQLLRKGFESRQDTLILCSFNLPQNPASEIGDNSVHDIKGKSSWSFSILLVVSQRCCNGRCLGAVFSDLLYSRIRTVMRIEEEDTEYNEKRNFRVSSVYHLSQYRKWQPGPIISIPLWHAPEYGPCQFVQTSSYLK